MKKRILSMAVALCMIIGLLPTVVFAAENGLSSTKTKVAAGDSFKVTVTIPSISALLANVQMNVEFDKDCFEVESSYVTDSNATSSNNASEANTTGKVSVLYAPGDNQVNLSSGYTFTIPFKVKNTAIAGNKTITLNSIFTSLADDGYTETNHEPAGLLKTLTIDVVSAITGTLPVAITKPAKGDPPETTISGTNFTGSITWSPAVAAGGKFAANTAYTAKVELTANTGYQFANGVNPTVAGSDSVTDVNVKGSGSKLEFKATFPKTNDKDSLPTSTSVSISGTPQIDRPLTANVTGLPASPGALTYKWYRDGETTPISGANTDTYTPSVAADVGKQIKVEVSAANYSGSVTSAPTAAVAKADYTGSSATAAVTDNAHRWDTKIEITNVTTGQEYAITAGSTEPTEGWQDGGVFTELTKDTAYTVYTRVKAKDTMAASTSVTTSVKTKKAMYPLAFDLSGLTSVYHYNGSAQNPSVSYKSGYSAATVGGITFKYEENHGSYAPVSECKLPGAYRVTIVTNNTGSDYAAGESFVGVFSISRGNLTAANFQVTGLTTYDYDGSPKNATVALQSGVEGVGAITVYYEGVAPTVYTRQTTAPTDAGSYKVSVNVATGDYYNGVDNLELGTLTINKVDYPGTTTFTETVRSGQDTTDKALTLPALPAGASYDTPVVGGTTPALISAKSVSGTTLTYSTTSQLNNTSATITIPVTSATNYNNYSIVVTVTAKDKEDAGVSISGAPTSKTYGDENFTLTATKTAPNGGTWSWTSSDDTVLNIVSGADSETAIVQVLKASATGATLTVTYESDTHMGTAITATIKVNPKDVTITGITAKDKKYDRSDTATPTGTAVIDGKVDGDDVSVTAGTATFADKNVGIDKTVTFTGYSLSGADAGNYNLTAQPASVTAKITAKEVTITGITATSRPYAKDNLEVDLTGGTVSGVISGDTVTVDLTNAKGTMADANAGSGKAVTVTGVVLGGTDKDNYNLTAQPSGVTVNITQATYGDKTASGSAKYGASGTVDLSGLIVAGGTASYKSVTDTDNVLNGTPAMAADGKTLNFAFKDVAANATKTADIVVVVTSTNYQPYDITVTVTVNDKLTPAVNAPTAIAGLEYNGSEQVLIAAGSTTGGTLKYSLTSGSGYDTVLPKGKDAKSYTVYYKVEGNTEYADVAENSITVNIGRKAVSVAPKAVSITKGSAIPTFELVYTGLVSGESLTPTPAPTFTCYETGTTTPVSTSTAAGSYTITWTNMAGTTFTGGANYAVTPMATANLTISNPSSSGGGGGGSYTPSYTVSVDKTENGTITVSPKSASKGDTVTITVKPDKGYELDTLKVLDKNGDKVKLTEKNGKYTFTMPTGKVTVKGSFVEEAPVQIFKDIPVDAYYYEAVKWAAEKGITGGVGNGLFAPNQPCTRAQIVTFLWRAAGSPEPKTMSSFADVPADTFYAKAVAWAVENGITGGTGDGKFSPDATCTRAQSVTFLYRAAGSPAVSGSAEFGDVATNAYYADAVAWAAKNGITGGIGGGMFGSGNDCTRAQIVTFLYRNYQSK